MSSRTKKWLAGLGVTAALSFGGLYYAAREAARRFDPYIREQAIDYLSRRFDCDVTIEHLTVNIPRIPMMKLLLERGRGVMAEVTGEGIMLRQRGEREVPLTITMKRFAFAVDLGGVFDPIKRVSLVRVEGAEVQVPPRTPSSPAAKAAAPPAAKPSSLPIQIAHVELTDSRLIIVPRNKTRKPLTFELHRVLLDSIGADDPLRYHATLTNATPPGLVDATGEFGPWNASDPGETFLNGEYTFNNADLGVFSAITGTLNSKGTFNGTLSAVKAKGVADVPNFRLRDGGSAMPLHAAFDALVDGTNGNTTLQPVHARLGTSAFTTSGAILKHDGQARRTIDLDVNMPDGEMLELLTLAVKAKPFMSGRLQMRAKIRIGALQAKVSEKLVLDGKFRIQRGQFLNSGIQDKIDSLSRWGQGQRKNETIENVFSDMAGDFHLEHQAIDFRSLTFGVPGSRVELKGRYDVAKDDVDFRGALFMDAKLSQMMTGWKHWALKVADPFFAKNGAGTYLKIKVQGTSKDPHFGMVW